MSAMARGKQAKAKTKSKTKAKAKPVKKAAKPKRAAVEDDDEHEPSDAELMLQTLSCPTATADRLAEICAGSVDALHDELGGISAAQLVWRDRPDRQAIGAAVEALVAEIERHAATMLAVYDQLRAVADDESDHDDLQVAEVMERLRPMLNEMPAED
jgi:hypothetical protein